MIGAGRIILEGCVDEMREGGKQALDGFRILSNSIKTEYSALLWPRTATLRGVGNTPLTAPPPRGTPSRRQTGPLKTRNCWARWIASRSERSRPSLEEGLKEGWLPL